MDLKERFKKGGVIITPPSKTDAIYELVFGAETPQEIPDWSKYLPVFERQGNTTGCVSFARLNIAETMAKKEGLELNLSDRHLFVLSGTTKSGNSLNPVAEAFRTLGIVKEEFFQWKPEYLENQSDYWQEIFNTATIPNEARRYFGGNHSWVNVKNKDEMKSALAFSPLQLAFAVYETYQDAIILKGKNVLSYHSTMCYWIDDDGNYRIFDSADGAIKILDKDYPLEQCKSFRDLPLEWKLSLENLKTLKEKTILALLNEILKKIVQWLGIMSKEIKTIPPAPITPPVVPPVIPPPAPPIATLAGWETPIKAIHSARVIMDEFNLLWEEKALLCAVIMCESGFRTDLVHQNDNGTADFGIVQVNSAWWIGVGKKFPSIDYVVNNPEACVRWMIECYKKGLLKWWVCYSKNLHQKYLAQFLEKP